MNYTMINQKINGYEIKINDIYARIKKRMKNEFYLEPFYELNLKILESDLANYEATTLLSLKETDKKLYNKEKRKLKNLRKGIKTDFNLISNYKKYIDKYLVELHKKFSIPFASLIFIIIGAPLGILSKKGGFAMSTSISLGFFVIYWGFLIGGEEFADRGIIPPLIAMWQPNFFLGILGLLLILYMSTEKKLSDFIKLLLKPRGNN